LEIAENPAVDVGWIRGSVPRFAEFVAD